MGISEQWGCCGCFFFLVTGFSVFRLLSFLVSCVCWECWLWPLMKRQRVVWKQYSGSKSSAYIVVRLTIFFFFLFPVPLPKKHQVEWKFTSKVLIRSHHMKKVTVGGCTNADCLCEPEEIQAEIQAVWSLLLLLWLEFVHMNNKTE